jgi:hypothetical protein
MVRYQVNRPRIVDETVEGEALVMDMVTGSYFGCTGPSALAWIAVKGGATAEELADLLAERFAVEPAAVSGDIERFLAALAAHELVVERAADDPRPLDLVAEYDGVAAEYEPLAIEVFTDLADLILLDPVHEVSEAGWPHRQG